MLWAYRSFMQRQNHGRKRVETFRKRLLHGDLSRAWNQWSALAMAEAEARRVREATEAAHARRIGALMAAAVNRGLRRGFSSWKATLEGYRTYMASISSGAHKLRVVRGRALHRSLSLAWRSWSQLAARLQAEKRERELQRRRVTRILAATTRRGALAAWATWVGHVRHAREQEASAVRLLRRLTSRW